MGIKELPGGFVLTGGQAGMPGVLSLAQDVLQNNVRVASPNYIGVREPQYMTGVGLIQFAYRNAKIQGRKVGFKMPEQAVQEVAATHQKKCSSDRSQNPSSTLKLRKAEQNEENI